jgi:hypothetical protein
MKKNLGQRLVDAGLIDQKVLGEGLQRQVIFGGRLGTNLMEMGALSEEDLLKVLSTQHGLAYADHRHFDNIPPQVLESVPKDLLAKYRIVPIHIEKNRITMAMADPTDLSMIDEVAFHTGKTVQPVIATELRIVQALEKYYDIRREARYIAAPADVIREQEEARMKAAEEKEAEPLELSDDDLEIIDPLDFDEINRAFFSVQTRDDVAQTVIEASLRTMSDAFMFLIKGDEAIGWMSGGSAKPLVDFGTLKVDLGLRSIIDEVRENRTLERRPGVDTFEGNPWLKELSLRVPKEVVVCPLVIKKHLVSVIVGFNFKTPLTEEEAEFLVRTMRKASVVFEVLILRSKIVML